PDESPERLCLAQRVAGLVLRSWPARRPARSPPMVAPYSVRHSLVGRAAMSVSLPAPRGEPGGGGVSHRAYTARHTLPRPGSLPLALGQRRPVWLLRRDTADRAGHGRGRGMQQTPARREHQYGVALLLVILLLVAMAVTLPFILASIFNQFGGPEKSVYTSSLQDTTAPDHRITLNISEMDEVGGTVTMFASAARTCNPDCSTSDHVIVRSVDV